MRNSMTMLWLVLLSAALTGPIIAQSSPSGHAATEGVTAVEATPSANQIDEMESRIIAQEQNETAFIKTFSPLTETYVQRIKLDDERGEVPIRDDYFLGRAKFGKREIATVPIIDAVSKASRTDIHREVSRDGFIPEGFLQLSFVDERGIDKHHYAFKYRGEEFLGEVRCKVFDVYPRNKSTRGLFMGRIWAEDQGYRIVRFSGTYTNKGLYKGKLMPHFDSWRLNLQPDVWLPAYIYTQEIDRRYKDTRVSFRAQTRLWGYDIEPARWKSEFSSLSVENPSNPIANSSGPNDQIPLQQKREWQSEAEQNAIEGLEKAGLLAPAGDEDKMLDAYVNNLEVSNNLDIEPEIQCRVATLGSFDMFAIGHTIVLSRGLLDALPDDGPLAALLSQEIADVMIPKPRIDKFGFGSFDDVAPNRVRKIFSFRDTRPESVQVDKKAIEIFKKSPYAAKIGSAGLFIEALNTNAKALPELISPQLGNNIYLAKQLLASAPPLRPDDLTQIAALPIGSRVSLNPWNDDAKPIHPSDKVALTDARDKLPFAITPFEPYLTRYPSQQSTRDPSPAKMGPGN